MSQKYPAHAPQADTRSGGAESIETHDSRWAESPESVTIVSRPNGNRRILIMRTMNRLQFRVDRCVTRLSSACSPVSPGIRTSPGVGLDRGPDWEGDVLEDAGDKPGNAQKVVIDGFDTVKTIKGKLEGDSGGLAGEGLGDYQDCYIVVIDTPGEFEINTSPIGGASSTACSPCTTCAAKRSSRTSMANRARPDQESETSRPEATSPSSDRARS